ncbi:MAG: hypothetical protein ACYS9X_20825 [Planctomycetota bacterium]
MATKPKSPHLKLLRALNGLCRKEKLYLALCFAPVVAGFTLMVARVEGFDPSRLDEGYFTKAFKWQNTWWVWLAGGVIIGIAVLWALCWPVDKPAVAARSVSPDALPSGDRPGPWGSLRLGVAFGLSYLIYTMTSALAVIGIGAMLLYAGCSRTTMMVITLPTGLGVLYLTGRYVVSPVFDVICPTEVESTEHARPPDGSDAAKPNEGEGRETG